ncbi:hypothetical protein QZH41_019020 [Actinostola sp. cb2023]|nr:hypothetical protein QZH41_019020 [Actinostola sp. cb2023]
MFVHGNLILDDLVYTNQLEQENRVKIKEILLRKHIHQFETSNARKPKTTKSFGQHFANLGSRKASAPSIAGMDKKNTVIEGSKSVPFNLADLSEEPEPVKSFPFIPSAVSLVGQGAECTQEECKNVVGNDTVTVLPPGEWDPSIRIEPPASIPSQEKRLEWGNKTDEDHDPADREEHLRRTGRKNVLKNAIFCQKITEGCFLHFLSLRAKVSDFAVLISILVFVGIDLAFDVNTPKLQIPLSFRPTASEKRGWLVSPLGKNPAWVIIAAAIPAVLATILVFMDQQITALIVNRREHKLKKGAGYHLDLFLVAIIIGICSVFGLPWIVAATVLSVSHVQSLFVESQCTAPGEKTKFLGVR